MRRVLTALMLVVLIAPLSASVENWLDDVLPSVDESPLRVNHPVALRDITLPVWDVAVEERRLAVAYQAVVLNRALVLEWSLEASRYNAVMETARSEEQARLALVNDYAGRVWARDAKRHAKRLDAVRTFDYLDQRFRIRLTPQVVVDTCDITAASPSRTNVVNAIEDISVVTGSEVCIDNGNEVWTIGYTVTKAITLRGKNNCTLDGDGRPTSCPVIIKDGIVARTGMLVWSLVANQTSRMSHIEIQNNDATINCVADQNLQNNGGVLSVVGTNTDARRMRFDHIKAADLCGMHVFVYSALGVIDHSWLYKSNQRGILAYVVHENWDGYTRGDGSFADTVDVNDEDQWWVFEDNTLEYDGYFYAFADAHTGARYIARHNDIINAWAEAHGTDSTVGARGTRALLVHNNTYLCDEPGSCISGHIGNLRSGASSLFMDNTASGYGTTPWIQLAAYRLYYAFQPWGAATGENGWDANGTDPSLSGTATSGGQSTMTDSGASFGSNDSLVGYSLIRTNCGWGLCQGQILSNTNTTINIATSQPDSITVLQRYVVAASPAPTDTTATTSTSTAGNSYEAFPVGSYAKLGCDSSCTCTKGTRRITASDSGGALTWSPAASSAVAAGEYICLAPLTFAAGDTYRVKLVDRAYDQPGRGQGTLLVPRSMSGCTSSGTTVTCNCNGGSCGTLATGDYAAVDAIDPRLYRGTYQITMVDADTFTFTSPWSNLSAGTNYGSVFERPATNDQVTEPNYECRNTQGAENIGYSSTFQSLQMQASRDFYSDTCYPGFTDSYPHYLVTP